MPPQSSGGQALEPATQANFSSVSPSNVLNNLISCCQLSPGVVLVYARSPSPGKHFLQCQFSGIQDLAVPVHISITVLLTVYYKQVKVITFPAHGSLQYPVEFWKSRPGWHSEYPPNRRFDVLQLNFDLVKQCVSLVSRFLVDILHYRVKQEKVGAFSLDNDIWHSSEHILLYLQSDRRKEDESCRHIVLSAGLRKRWKMRRASPWRMADRQLRVYAPPVAQRCSESGKPNPDFIIFNYRGLDTSTQRVSSLSCLF